MHRCVLGGSSSQNTHARRDVASVGLLAVLVFTACGSPAVTTQSPVADTHANGTSLASSARPDLALRQTVPGQETSAIVSDPSMPEESRPLQEVASRYITNMLAANDLAGKSDVDARPGLSVLGDLGVKGFESLRAKGTLSRIVFAYYNKNADPRNQEPAASVGGAVQLSDSLLYYFMADQHFKNNRWLIFQFNFM